MRVQPRRARLALRACHRVDLHVPGGRHARSRHRRHRPHADRPGEQGVARRLPPRRPLRARSSTRCSTRCRSSTRAQVEDVIWGCGQPAGEAGLQRRRASPRILAGVDVPGVTVNRYCSSSLQTIRMAAHAIKAGEGDVFISGGVETVSRFAVRRGRHRRARTRSSATARDRTKERTDGGQPPWTPPDRPSRRLHRDGPDRGERASRPRTSTREEMDEFGAHVAAARGRRAGERVLRAGDHAGHARRRHRRHARTTARAPARRSRSSRR